MYGSQGGERRQRLSPTRPSEEWSALHRTLAGRRSRRGLIHEAQGEVGQALVRAVFVVELHVALSNVVQVGQAKTEEVVEALPAKAGNP